MLTRSAAVAAAPWISPSVIRPAVTASYAALISSGSPAWRARRSAWPARSAACAPVRPGSWAPAEPIAAAARGSSPGPGPRVGEQPGRGARGGQPGVHAGEPVDVLGAAGEGDRGGRGITGPQVRGGGRPVQPQRLVARGPDLGGRGRAFQRPGGGRRVAGQRRGLLVALLRLAEPAAGEQQPGERRRQPSCGVRPAAACGGERGRPAQGRAELVGGGVEGRLPLRLGRVGAVEPGRLGQAPAQVPAAGAAVAAGIVGAGLGVQPGRGELANRFQGVVPRPPGTGHGHQQAVLGEPGPARPPPGLAPPGHSRLPRSPRRGRTARRTPPPAGAPPARADPAAGSSSPACRAGSGAAAVAGSLRTSRLS